MKVKLLRKTDVIIILLVLMVCGGFFLVKNYNAAENLVAEISVNGEIVETLDLNSITERKEIKLNTNPAVIIEAEKGKIKFKSSDCPDKICVNAGELTKKGDTAVCLPAKTVISIAQGELDAVTY